MSSRVANLFSEDDLLITVEVHPPRGAKLDQELTAVSKVDDRVAAVNITDNHMARLRMNPTIFAYHIQEQLGLTTIPHITCRDKNLLGLQSELLAAGSLDVNNFLALTGDDPAKGDHPTATGVFDVDSIELVDLISNLKTGCDVNGKELASNVDLTAGVGVNPAAEDLDEEIERLYKKVDAGAEFIQTQPIYDPEIIIRFLDLIDDLDVPLLAGILPLKDDQMANYFNTQVPGIKVPDKVVARMKDKGLAEGIKLSQELITELEDKVDGIHIMPIGGVEVANKIIRG
ncbi:MAG: methylenetetrahydrofolate reductase [Bacillota bacterium]